MNTHTSMAAILAMAAVGAPMICQAQDPASAYGQVLQLRQQNRNEDALKLIDNVLKMLDNPSSRVGAQFAHFTPFFYWQKGDLLSTMGRYDEAFATFEALRTKDRFKDKELIKRSCSLPGQPEGYQPLVSAAQFQMGNIRYKQASGKDGKGGNPALYDEAIKLLEDYLGRYETRKVTKWELSKKLDGTVCFLLMQSNLLKPTPNFAKAGEYIEKGRKSKAMLPDDMVFGGLGTLINIALKNPKYIEWGEKMISGNPGSFNLTTDRLTVYAPSMFNYGVQASKIWEDALYAGDMQQAVSAGRTVYSLFGLVPDVRESSSALQAVLKSVEKSATPLVDRGLGVNIDPVRNKKLADICTGLTDDKTELEAYAILTLSNMAYKMGSPRLAKAGYKVLLDRYADLQQKKDDGLTPLRDINTLQYVQFARLTGDEATAEEYEKRLDPTKMGGDANKVAVLVNKMARLVKPGVEKWDEVLSVTEEIMQVLANDKSSVNYVSASFNHLHALYKKQQYDKAVAEGEALLTSGLLAPGTLTEDQSRNFTTYVYYFCADAASRLGSNDPTFLDKSVNLAEEYMVKFPAKDLAQNPMAPNIYYLAISVLTRRLGHGKDEAAKVDLQKAQRYCQALAKNWPDHELAPNALLMAANILISDEDDSVKGDAIPLYEQAVDSALKLPDGKGKGVAVDALYKLASYAPEYDREGEDAAAKSARVAGYIDRFWKEADYEGNPYSLQMAALQLNRSLSDRNKDAYTACMKHAQEIIAREANFAFNANTQNTELEPTINTYVQAYVDGSKQLLGKDLTLEDKMAHLTSFPGISKDDKYTNAILHMALLTSMEEAMYHAKKKGDTNLVNDLDRDIRNSFRQMRDQFKPEELTNFICVRVGKYEVDYARRLPASSRKQEVDMALKYFEQVLSRNSDMVAEANLGKADALSLMGDDSSNKQAFDLYTSLAAGSNPEVVGPALMGLTDLNMSMRNYKAAVDSADRYVNMRGVGTASERTKMQLKLAEAFCESGDVQKGLQTYMNIYQQNRGNISVSAPTCKAMMEQFWKRNEPSTGDRIKGGFKQSDRWRAWYTGQDYVRQVRMAKLEEKMTPAERDLFNDVVILVEQYSKDPQVMKENKENDEFKARLSK